MPTPRSYQRFSDEIKFFVPIVTIIYNMDIPYHIQLVYMCFHSNPPSGVEECVTPNLRRNHIDLNTMIFYPDRVQHPQGKGRSYTSLRRMPRSQGLPMKLNIKIRLSWTSKGGLPWPVLHYKFQCLVSSFLSSLDIGSQTIYSE